MQPSEQADGCRTNRIPAAAGTFGLQNKSYFHMKIQDLTMKPPLTPYADTAAQDSKAVKTPSAAPQTGRRRLRQAFRLPPNHARRRFLPYADGAQTRQGLRAAVFSLWWDK